jgi:hypothetical protein
MALLSAILFSLFESSLEVIDTTELTTDDDDNDVDVDRLIDFDVSIISTSTGSLVDLLRFHNDTLPPEVKVTNTAGLMRLHCTSHT